MASDVPFVSYKKEKPKSESKSAMDKLAERWKEKNGDNKMVGKKISLSEYFRNANNNTNTD